MTNPFGPQLDPGMGINATATADAGASDPNQPPDEFSSYIAIVLWKQGVDVSSMSIDQKQQLILELWQDPFLQNMYNTNYVGGIGTDPLTGAPVTDANFETAISNELFDPTKTHSQFLVSQGVQMLQLSGRQLTSAQQNYSQNLGGGSPAVLQALARAANDAGVPYNVALAVAMAESGLDPRSKGDYDAAGNPTSFGLFKLHIGGELTSAGLTPDQAMDPYTNALVALKQFAAVAQQDPSVVNDPGRWAALAQRPRDPTAYASRVNNLLQSGFGGAPSSLVPKPFDGNFPITEDHDEGDPGIDYGTPVGTSMYTPFAGTIRVEDKGKADWGKRVMVVLDNGYTFAIGHLTSFSVSDGQRVNPGDLLGLSGGALSDPSSGNSTGPHVELQWISPGGNFLDPHVILDPILAGTATFRSLNLTGAEGSGVSATSAQDRLLGIDPALEAKYPGSVSAFEKYFGRHPTSAELMNLINATGGNPNAIDSYLRAQPSHIPGVSMGMYNDVKSNLDSVSQKMFGHSGTDGMIKDLVGEGKTSPTAIEYWLEQQDIQGKMDPGQYQTLYNLSQPHMQSVYNQSGFDPRIAQNLYNQAQQQGVTIPSAPPPTPGYQPPPAEALTGGALVAGDTPDIQKTINDTQAGVF